MTSAWADLRADSALLASTKGGATFLHFPVLHRVIVCPSHGSVKYSHDLNILPLCEGVEERLSARAILSFAWIYPRRSVDIAASKPSISNLLPSSVTRMNVLRRLQKIGAALLDI